MDSKLLVILNKLWSIENKLDNIQNLLMEKQIRDVRQTQKVKTDSDHDSDHDLENEIILVEPTIASSVSKK